VRDHATPLFLCGVGINNSVSVGVCAGGIVGVGVGVRVVCWLGAGFGDSLSEVGGIGEHGTVSATGSPLLLGSEHVRIA
jgi:hypothetical protein